MAKRQRTTLYRKDLIGGVIPRSEWNEIVLIMYRIIDAVITYRTADTLIINQNTFFALRDKHVISKLLFNHERQPTTSLETALNIILRHDTIARSYLSLTTRKPQARIYAIRHQHRIDYND